MGGYGLSKKLKSYIYSNFENLQEACLASYGKRIQLLNSQFCSGFIHAKGKKICNEDLGAPFINDGRLAGVLSYVDSHSPYSFVKGEIYIKIAYFRSWINAQIREYYIYTKK